LSTCNWNSRYFKIEWVFLFSGKPWKLENLEWYKTFKIEWVNQFPNKPWDWTRISKSQNFQIEWIKLFPNEPWDWTAISKSQNFQIEWIKLFPNEPWDWFMISGSPNFKIEWVNQYPNELWNWSMISGSPNLKIEWVNQFPNELWNWSMISGSPNLKIEWVNQFPNKPWSWKSILMFSKTPLDLEIDEKYISVVIKMISCQYLYPITIKFNVKIIQWIIENIHCFEKLKHIFEVISMSNYFNTMWIDMFPNAPWNWYYISSNNNITIKFIKKYFHKINFQGLSQNPFTKQDCMNQVKFHSLILNRLSLETDLQKLIMTYCIGNAT